jgi:hypothetical protein
LKNLIIKRPRGKRPRAKTATWETATWEDGHVGRHQLNRQMPQTKLAYRDSRITCQFFDEMTCENSRLPMQGPQARPNDTVRFIFFHRQTAVAFIY